MTKNNQLEVMYVTPTGKDAKGNLINNNYIKTVDDVKRAFDNKKPMFIEFYADWCEHCKTLSELWKDLIKELEKNNKTSNMAIIAVEKDHHDNQHIKNIISKASFNIEGYPTVGAIVFNGGKPSFKPYKGERTVNGMHKFIKDNILSSSQSGGHKHKTNKKHKSSHKKGKKHNRKTIKKHRKTTYRKTKHHRK